ncbi:MAG: hypothetical protein WB781_06290 [Candidatus Sulfotelmatobacter sp.]
MTFMGVSPAKSKSNIGQVASAKLAFQKILYCGSFFVALLACVALSAVTVNAQEELPQITPGERKVPRKKEAGPRAVAVLQLAANGKASLVPIAILVSGKFWDATEYKADPIPMALEPGTVYEAERAGSSLGLFTVNSALHSNAVNVQTPWIGTGAWVPEGSEKPKTALRAEKEPVGIETNDAPPRLTRSTPKETPPASTAPASAPPANTSGGSAGSGQTSQGQTSQGQTSQGQTSPGQTSPSQTTPNQTSPNQTASQTGSTPTSTSPPAPNSSAPTPPGNSKPSDAKPADRPSTPQSDSGADEANRPRLRRGKPVEPLPEDEVPGYSKPGAVASAAAPANAGKTSEQTADKSSVQLIPAISDASGPPPKSFAFEWLKDEEGERLQQMTTLATEQVRAYVAAQAKAKIMPMPAPKSASPQTARRAAASKTPTSKTKDPILENVQMKSYDLWGNNQPVLVLTAEAHMPPPPAGTPHAAVDSELQYSILLVANPDIYNNLHKLFVAVTDKYHLDITPRLELVDAVDADGDGRGELLFREISDNGNGWRIYRATADKLWKMFDSLNPE